MAYPGILQNCELTSQRLRYRTMHLAWKYLRYYQSLRNWASPLSA